MDQDMDQDIAANETDAAATTDAPEADELLIEEISIDGMCGVY